MRNDGPSRAWSWAALLGACWVLRPAVSRYGLQGLRHHRGALLASIITRNTRGDTLIYQAYQAQSDLMWPLRTVARMAALALQDVAFGGAQQSHLQTRAVAAG
ncbi:MAG: hypothetical protein B7Z52_06905, partial [Burkholderiales bacterium 12-64-5]